jgi:hypothetical protein
LLSQTKMRAPRSLASCVGGSLFLTSKAGSELIQVECNGHDDLPLKILAI